MPLHGSPPGPRLRKLARSIALPVADRPRGGGGRALCASFLPSFVTASACELGHLGFPSLPDDTPE